MSLVLSLAMLGPLVTGLWIWLRRRLRRRRQRMGIGSRLASAA
jgi:uncharacterized iron-regulated membrane protein